MKTLLSAAFALLAVPLTLFAEPLKIGDVAPTLTGATHDGRTVNFGDVYSKGTTLVYFYPKADTPGCTKQACSLRDNYSKIQERGIQILGVSEDNVDTQKQFQEKYSLPFPLVADPRGKIAEAFQVPLNGRVTKRQSFLIKEGKVVWMMLDKTSTDKHADDILKADEETAKKG